MDFKDKLLAHFNLTNDDYLLLTKEVSYLDIPDPSFLKDIDKAKKRILESIKNNENVLVYGDYDGDGITATSIIVKMYQILGKKIAYYVPSRYLDGYGITADKVIKAKEKGFSLIITVDNGVSAFDALNKAKELGIDVILSDHHEFSEVPPCYAFIHPKNSNIPSLPTSGAVMAFYLAYAVLEKVDDYLLSLAALSLISDMMPLTNYNRNLLRLGINAINNNQYPSFTFLAKKSEFDENVLGMDVTPKVNAVGRIVEGNEVNRLVKYFTTDDINELKAIGFYIENINEERKEYTLTAEDNIPSIKEDEPAIVLLLDIKEGLMGLLANRLLNEYKKPVAVFSIDSKDSDKLRGSLRSKEGMDITDFYHQYEDLLLEHGGHALAGGLTINKLDYEKFSKAFNEFAKSHPFTSIDKEAVEISLIDINEENYNILRSLAPFGMGFKEPNFIIRNVKSQVLKPFGKNENHVKAVLGTNTNIIGFNFDMKKLENSVYLDLKGSFRKSNFMGKRSIDFILIE